MTYTIQFDRVNPATGYTKQVRIEWLPSLDRAREKWADDIKPGYQSFGYRLDHACIIGPFNEVYDVERR
jgi:hypothetical protein